jgi:hypothetical protein
VRSIDYPLVDRVKNLQTSDDRSGRVAVDSQTPITHFRDFFGKQIRLILSLNSLGPTGLHSPGDFFLGEPRENTPEKEHANDCENKPSLVFHFSPPLLLFFPK